MTDLELFKSKIYDLINQNNIIKFKKLIETCPFDSIDLTIVLSNILLQDNRIKLSYKNNEFLIVLIKCKYVNLLYNGCQILRNICDCNNKKLLKWFLSNTDIKTQFEYMPLIKTSTSMNQDDLKYTNASSLKLKYYELGETRFKIWVNML